MKLRFEFSNKKGTINFTSFCKQRLSELQNQMRKKYFRIASSWIIWKWFFLSIYSVVLEIIILILRWPLCKISNKYTISPYVRLHPKGATISTNMCPHLNHQKLNVIRTSGSDYVSLVNSHWKWKGWNTSMIFEFSMRIQKQWYFCKKKKYWNLTNSTDNIFNWKLESIIAW